MTEPNALRILLVEDTPTLRMIYQGALSETGYHVTEAATLEAGRAAFRDTAPDLVLLDLMLPDGDGLDLMAHIHAARPTLPVIVITAHGSTLRTVEAMRAGAQNFLVKPFDEARLIEAVRAAVAPPLNVDAMPPCETLIGTSDIMRATHARLHAAAQSEAPIFITGESGSGKALCARAAHEASKRAAGKFIRIACAGVLPERMEREFCGYLRGAFDGALSDKIGLARQADRGTILFEDICELSLPMQSKLLSFIENGAVFPLGDTQSHKVDVRIICATSRDPLEELRAGRLREDLFYRLHVVSLEIPPLRARGGDILLLAMHALRQISQQEGRNFERISEAAAARLMAHPWPGNVRQLINMIRVAVVIHDGPVLEAHMIEPTPQIDALSQSHPETVHNAIKNSAGQTLAQIERAVIEAALRRNAESVTRAARELDVAASTLYRKIAAWGDTA